MSAADTYDVTVIIPTYNRLWSLPRAVESCRGARCRVQIVVVDDGSSDGTWEWLADQRDVVALRQPNEGKDWAVAHGLRHARGRWVKFLDSDDALVEGATDRQLAAATAVDADLVVSGMQIIDQSGAVVADIPYESTDDFVAQQLGEGFGSHYSAFLFRRELVAGIPHRQEFGSLDDRMFILEVALANPRIVESPAAALRHLYHENERLQHTAGLRQTVKEWCLLEVYRRTLGTLAARGELTPRRARAAALPLWRLAHDIARTHPSDAADIAAWVKRLDPGFRPPEPGVLGRAYERLGFRQTERILALRRRMLVAVRGPQPSGLPELPA